MPTMSNRQVRRGNRRLTHQLFQLVGLLRGRDSYLLIFRKALDERQYLNEFACCSIDNDDHYAAPHGVLDTRYTLSVVQSLAFAYPYCSHTAPIVTLSTFLVNH